MYSIQQRRRTSRWMMPPCSGRCPSFCIVVDKMERTSAKKRFKSLAGICKAGKMLQHLQLAGRTKYIQNISSCKLSKLKTKRIKSNRQKRHESRDIKGKLAYYWPLCHLLLICMILDSFHRFVQGAACKELTDRTPFEQDTPLVYFEFLFVWTHQMYKTKTCQSRMLVLKHVLYVFRHLRQMTVWHLTCRCVTFLTNLYSAVSFLGVCLFLPRNVCSSFSTHSTHNFYASMTDKFGLRKNWLPAFAKRPHFRLFKYVLVGGRGYCSFCSCKCAPANYSN